MKNKVLHGDCLVELKNIEDNSIDCIITDPPYGLSFINKNRDKQVSNVDIWKECYRVLKQGSFCFVMCTSMLDCLIEMSQTLKNAGFKINFSPIFWLYIDDICNSSYDGFTSNISTEIVIVCMKTLPGDLCDTRFPSNVIASDSNFGDDIKSEIISENFSVDKWFEHKLKELPKGIRKSFPYIFTQKSSKKEKSLECEDLLPDGVIDQNTNRKISEEMKRSYKGNFHPTAKPVKLMSYLITLGSRENETILDPFCGSGATLVASVMMNRKYIGIELEEDYVKISKDRVGKTKQEYGSDYEKQLEMF